MRARLAAAALLLAAAGLWLGVTVPARRQRDAARAEFVSARARREQLRVEMAAFARSSTAGHSPGADAAAVRAMRASLLRAAEALDVGDVQIAASSDRAHAGASGRVSADGRMADAVQLADRLARPDSGVLLERVGLASAHADSPAVRVDVECLSAGSGR